MEVDLPKRKFPWWRLARWSMASLVVAVIVAHSMWGMVVEQGVKRRVEALRKAGEPILPEDFTPPVVPDADNAAVDIEAATTLMVADDPAWDTYARINIALPLRPKERDALVAVQQRFNPAMDLIDEARDKPAMELKLNLTSPVFFNIALPSFNGIRSLCMLEADGALFEHDRGDDASAIRRIDRALFICRYPDRQPALVGHLVSIGCIAAATERAAQIAPDLKIGSAAGAAAPQDVRNIIELLLDDRPMRAGLVRSLQGERMAELDMVQGIMSGVAFAPAPGQRPISWNPLSRYALRPVFYRNARTMLDYTTAVLAISDETNYPSARAKMPPTIQNRSILDAVSSMFLPSLDRVIETQFRVLTERRLAATALAIRWYATEHEGKLPQKLDELVPRYLPAVPADPSAGDGRQLAYLARGNDPIVYSVGTDGVDDDGSEAAPTSRGKRPARSEWEMRDRVLHLNRQPRPKDDDDQDVPAIPATSPTSSPAPG